jgi:hypothetical protein
MHQALGSDFWIEFPSILLKMSRAVKHHAKLWRSFAWSQHLAFQSVKTGTPRFVST